MTAVNSDSHLVPLRPLPTGGQACPFCGSDAAHTVAVVFPGIHIMADRSCSACGHSFLQDLPVGFAVDHPMTIDKASRALLCAEPHLAWIHGPLLAAWKAPEDAAVKVERVVNRSCDRVIILNTLDFLYGHVLLKLYNAAHYLDRYPDHGLIVIVPRMFLWLVPKEVAEVWVVDLGLGRMHGWYPAIDRFVQERLTAYREVHLARGYAHPVFAPIDIARFTGERAFPLEQFTARAPHITLVAREDRLWFASPFGKFAYRVLNKLGSRDTLGRWYVRAQDRLIRRTIRLIRKRLPNARFAVVGLAQGGGLKDVAQDLRTRRMSEEVERAWVKAYAASQVVVGVHGSNMLLPTAHAAGCVEILPHDRVGNIVQDISVRWHDRMQLFLYRFVDEFASPRTVAAQVVSIFTEFSNYHRNNCINGFGSEHPGQRHGARP